MCSAHVLNMIILLDCKNLKNLYSTPKNWQEKLLLLGDLYTDITKLHPIIDDSKHWVGRTFCMLCSKKCSHIYSHLPWPSYFTLILWATKTFSFLVHRWGNRKEAPTWLWFTMIIKKSYKCTFLAVNSLTAPLPWASHYFQKPWWFCNVSPLLVQKIIYHYKL